MKLIDYIKPHGAQSSLAREISVSSVSVHHWANGIRPIPIKKCVRIFEATKGLVTLQEMRPDDWGAIWPDMKCKDEAE